MFFKILLILTITLTLAGCDYSVATPEVSNQALQEVSPYQSLLTPSSKTTNENIYYYYPVGTEQTADDRIEEDQNIEDDNVEITKKRRNHNRRKDGRKHKRKFAKNSIEAQRRNAQRRNANSIQSTVNTVFPYVFVALPLFIFMIILFIFFVNANAGQIEWYARSLADPKLPTIDETNMQVQSAISNLTENFDDVGPGHSINKRSAASIQPFVTVVFPWIFTFVPLGVFAFVIFYFVLIANGGLIDYYYKRSFNKRSTDHDDKFGTFDELHSAIDGYLGKYVEALTSEECMENTVCRLGQAASNLPRKELIFGVMEWLSPKNDGLFSGNRMDIMKMAAAGEIETCDKYVCKQQISHGFTGNTE